MEREHFERFVEGQTFTWQYAMDLGHFAIKTVFLDTYAEDYSTIADTEAMWEYRDATINWYVPAAIALDEKDIEKTVIHELVHVMLNPIEEKVKEKHADLREFAVESMARALWRVRYGE